MVGRLQQLGLITLPLVNHDARTQPPGQQRAAWTQNAGITRNIGSLDANGTELRSLPKSTRFDILSFRHFLHANTAQTANPKMYGWLPRRDALLPISQTRCFRPMRPRPPLGRRPSVKRAAHRVHRRPSEAEHCNLTVWELSLCGSECPARDRTFCARPALLTRS